MSPSHYSTQLRLAPAPAGHRRFALAAVGLLALVTTSVTRAGGDPVDLPKYFATATKLPTETAVVPGMASTVSGQDLLDRGVRDLRGALALVGGLDVGPGGDSGPAGSAPGLWGLREVDAFLLVVDGVPSGGAFNPALASLDLTNVERIEVLRGAAPVTFGATSFVGVIHVIHRAAGQAAASLTVGGGTPGTATAAWTLNLPAAGNLAQSLTLNGERRSFSQDDSDLARLHALYRGAATLPAGSLRVDLEFTSLRQSPYSPHPREGGGLTARFPLDANVNPSDARQDLNRGQLNAVLDHNTSFGQWTTTVSLARTTQQNTRGFLREDFASDGTTVNADGYRQKVGLTDLYVNSFLSLAPGPTLNAALGADLLSGRGRQTSQNFEYAVFPDGRHRPDSRSLRTDEFTALDDTRNFAGLYSELQWTPGDRWHLVGGLRLNHTAEKRAGSVRDDTGALIDSGDDRLTQTRLAGSVGATFTLWKNGADYVNAFSDYRDTYKPAALDFGPEGEGDILKPETARSWQTGVRGSANAGRLTWEASYFNLRFENLVIRENIGGLPARANAGREHFKGFEFESSYALSGDLRVSAAYAYHDARFTDYARLRPDNSVQQLAGKRLELSPQTLAALGLVYAPALGPVASLTWNRTGRQFLNKTNTSASPAYATVDAGLGYRTKRWSARLDGTNLGDRRDPAAESEIGDAQFYRLPGRALLLSVTMHL
ncbi:MAG: TonB-dependent receptor [Opitutae bacterium]|nr:TonB-dependent receptor [Opitutae bacterium]